MCTLPSTIACCHVLDFWQPALKGNHFLLLKIYDYQETLEDYIIVLLFCGKCCTYWPIFPNCVHMAMILETKVGVALWTLIFMDRNYDFWAFFVAVLWKSNFQAESIQTISSQGNICSPVGNVAYISRRYLSISRFMTSCVMLKKMHVVCWEEPT